MPNADLNITVRGRTPYLRADIIRRDTILAIAAALRDDPDNDLLNKLDDLGAVVLGNPSEGELDDLVGDVEDLADMGRAEMRLSRGDLGQLARQSADAVAELSPKRVAELLPRQQERRAS
jgi:hypothetical protein